MVYATVDSQCLEYLEYINWAVCATWEKKNNAISFIACICWEIFYQFTQLGQIIY